MKSVIYKKKRKKNDKIAVFLPKNDKIFAKVTKGTKATNAKKMCRTTMKKQQTITHLSESNKNGNPDRKSKGGKL